MGPLPAAEKKYCECCSRLTYDIRWVDETEQYECKECRLAFQEQYQQHQEQQYKCQDCGHIMTESELGVACAQYQGMTVYKLFCVVCGSMYIALQE